MTIKSKLAMIATSAALGVAALGIAAPAFAQSAYTTGTESPSVSTGYPSPFGSGAYAYAPGIASRHSRGREALHTGTFSPKNRRVAGPQSGLHAFGLVPSASGTSSFNRYDPSLTGGGSAGYNFDDNQDGSGQTKSLK
jgi:hypothetical protein